LVEGNTVHSRLVFSVLAFVLASPAAGQEEAEVVEGVSPGPSAQRADRPGFVLRSGVALRVRPPAKIVRVAPNCEVARVRYAEHVTFVSCLDEMDNPVGSYVFDARGKLVDLAPLVRARSKHTKSALSCLKPAEIGGVLVAAVTHLRGQAYDCGLDSQTSEDVSQFSAAVVHALDPSTGTVTEHKPIGRCGGIRWAADGGVSTLPCKLDKPLPVASKRKR
jgi:hypothetical protein